MGGILISVNYPVVSVQDNPCKQRQGWFNSSWSFHLYLLLCDKKNVSMQVQYFFVVDNIFDNTFCLQCSYCKFGLVNVINILWPVIVYLHAGATLFLWGFEHIIFFCVCVCNAFFRLCKFLDISQSFRSFFIQFNLPKT